ncbi:FAD-dependent oxidoreductase [Halalkalibacter urbisdiaboli]|uniref:FAD-dependent oxidoreductase n=1 Tax=Halalkalibacter urbisdiaboli TaxID=1960589 RepID=UPI000B445F09|nr:FAD-dependent oxidoreductase [Halalkalibacter urbisdiaboli]
MKYVIIGGDAAGMSAAMQIVRNDEQARITTLERGEVYSYAQCGIPYYISGVITEKEKLIARTVDTYRKKHGIDARVNHEVTGIDPKAKKVSGENFEVEYDRLLIATGASPVVPNWEGVDLQGIHTVKTIPHAEAIMSDLKQDVKKIVVIGGGAVGLEMTENFVELGKKVTIIERASHLAKSFDKELAGAIHKEAEEHGVNVILNQSVQSFKGNNKVEAVITDQQEIEADLVLVAIGIRPNTDFLKDSGLHLEESGAINVNAYMETNLPDIYAAGDCATQFHRMKQKADYFPLGTHANKQGRLAGLNMVGKTRAFQGIVGTYIMKFFDLTLASTGLPEEEIEKLGYPYKSVQADFPDIAGYYPGKERLMIRMLYHEKTEQLLGAQVIGKAGVDKRIDVLATALFNNNTMTQLEDLDLAYSPPYNGVWDPIQQTARRRG